jgi:hypothetical protein
MKLQRRSRGWAATLAGALAAAALACSDAAGPLAPEALGGLQPLAGPSAESSPLEVTFAKDLDAEASTPTFLVWRGTVGGAAAGSLVSSSDLTREGTRAAGKTLHAWLRWEIDAGDRSFVAETYGVVNFSNGVVRTNGRVVEGWQAGARVHQEGQLDLATLSAQGILRILPATAR